MMKHLTELARPSYPRIILSVREENPAVLFYSKLGFREVSRMENRVGGSSLVMTMDLAHAAREPDSVGGIQKA
jgi:ribosomal protein S18 acetylase RimI-like enzyme